MASNSFHLPEIPRNNLPSWPRGRVKASFQPSPISKDVLQPIRVHSSTSSSPATSRATSRASGTERKNSTSVKLPPLSPAAQQKISQLERDMHFLKSQHSETLCKLHEEIGRIKKKNKGAFFGCLCPSELTQECA